LADIEGNLFHENWRRVGADLMSAEYLNVDDDLAICGEPNDDEIMAKVLQKSHPQQESSNEEDDSLPGQLPNPHDNPGHAND